MNIYVKSLLYLIIFSILHFGYDLTHWLFLTPLCGINESVFQHLKMAFWAYLLACLIEYFIDRRNLNNRNAFWYSRLLSVITVPWFVMLIWYLVPALFGKVESMTLEILWSVFCTYFSGIAGGVVEKNIEKNVVTLGFRTVIIILFIVSVLLFIWFTYKPPLIDLFLNPEIL